MYVASVGKNTDNIQMYVAYKGYIRLYVQARRTPPERRKNVRTETTPTHERPCIKTRQNNMLFHI